MKKNTYLRRHIKEGWNHFKRNGLVSVTSVSSLAFMLFLVGATVLLSLNLNYMTNKVEENVEIHVYLKDTTSTERKAIENKIQSFSQVSTIKFISKKEGLQSFMKNLGDEGAAFQTLKKDNPLNDEFIVKTIQPQEVAAVANQIEKLALVDKVEYAENVVKPLIKSIKLARLIGAIFILILTIISVHLVTNTIKITVIARKEEIQLRKLIGAKNSFIRFPFFIEGSFIGLIGAFVADIFIVTGYYLVYAYFNKYIDIAFIKLLAPIPLIPFSCLVLLVIGALIGIWGATSSLRRLIKI